MVSLRTPRTKRYVPASDVQKKKKRKVFAPRKLNGFSIAPTLRSNFKNTMVYQDVPYILNPGTGGLGAAVVFSMNGLYDVDISGAGHQPTGFDQFTLMYSQYLVRRCYIKAMFHNTDATNAQLIGISVNSFGSAAVDTREYVENGNCVTTIIGPAGGESTKTLFYECDLQKLAGFNVDDDTDYAGTLGASPAQQIFAHVWARGVTTGDPGTVFASVELRFDVEWRKPILNQVS